jgi:hypothetical protein
MLLGSTLNMKAKRDHRKTNANVAEFRLIPCRFAKLARFAVALRFHTKGAVTVDHPKVLKTDVGASNGVIHVIETGVLPN